MITIRSDLDLYSSLHDIFLKTLVEEVEEPGQLSRRHQTGLQQLAVERTEEPIRHAITAKQRQHNSNIKLESMQKLKCLKTHLNFRHLQACIKEDVKTNEMKENL